MPDTSDIGSRLSALRKRRGLSQRELADAAGVSVATIRKIEQGGQTGIRLETAHRLARVLDVTTTRILNGPESTWRPPVPADVWQPVLSALETPPAQLPEQPTASGVQGALAGARALFGNEQYHDLGRMLPALLRDIAGLDDTPAARRLRYQAYQLTVSFLGQVRQHEAAEAAAQRALDIAADELEGGAVIVSRAQQLLRAGRLADVAELATQWARDVEPRISTATPQQLAVWGGLQLRVGAAAVRDNRRTEAADALRMAKVAAVALGQEVMTAPDHLRHFGPVTVTHQRAEHATIQRRPDRVLQLHKTVKVWRPVQGGSRSGRYRHLLDVADAHLRLHDDSQCVNVLRKIHAKAPQWLAAQRYAQDIMGRVIAQRRTLTPEMRELADATGVPM